MTVNHHATLVLLACAILIGTVSSLAADDLDPKDWSAWERFRATVQHPCAAIKPADLERARKNIEKHGWAREYVSRLRSSADSICAQVTPEYLERMLEHTTPGCTGPCPACRAKGLPWHPNGQWSWNPNRPDQLACKVCKTVFPNDEFPETVIVQSTWDPAQKFSFVGGDTFRCFSYTHARPSISGIIRGYKVGHVIAQLSNLGLAYALTGDTAYARATRAILLRIAEVLPKYLVFAGYGYGEYADCDPHVAAERINNLPVDELVYPPNQPDRKIHTGYWSASRLGSSGMDGGYVIRMAQAYDLTCEARDENGPVYSDQDRVRIERDVLLESAYLGACDVAINNKSVGNRAGVATVGMVVGHPGMVRFGLDGFVRTIEEWFLPDGGTSESPAYAMMTMSGIRDFALMFRNYTDPQGFTGPDGTRLEGFDACRDTRYGDCWQSLIWTLQGDLTHPPSADSYRTTTIGADFAELIALGYPTPQHKALLREYSDGQEAPKAEARAIFYRDPEATTETLPPFALPDIVFPFLAQGYLRTGEYGRDSLALLNASDYGGHHHLDSLDLYYWKDGRELLSDLGYLWDHPDSYQTRRTLSHNTVLIDSADQQTRDRRGSFHLFAQLPFMKAMAASSNAYPTAHVYRRDVIQIDHGQGRSYLLDIFRVHGGKRNQYVFHGPNNSWSVEGLKPAPAAEQEAPVRFAVRLHLGQLAEICIRNVEIRQVLSDGREGPNLAPNGDLAQGQVGRCPPGFGLYSGEGAYACELADGENGRYLRFEATKPHENGKVNVALLIGDSNGYVGPNALLGARGGTYRVRFHIRGNAPQVSVGPVMWPDDPNDPGDRTYAGSDRIAATDDWTKYAGEFTLRSAALQLDNRRYGRPEAPWSASWVLPGDYGFSAHMPAAPGEQVILADGWGQRDHRNTDRGATLPYVVREATGAQLNAFVSVFEGAPIGEAIVRGVEVLPLTADAPEDAVAVRVLTELGEDIVVSMPNPQRLSLATRLGTLETDGTLTAVLGTGDSASAAALVGGSNMCVGQAAITCNVREQSGKILSVGSGRGDSWFELDSASPDLCVGCVLLVTDGAFERAYPIRAVNDTRAYTKQGNTGFEARGGTSWRVLSQASWQRVP
ncbi:MAG: heparinase II/III family protein [Armatimonadetes bacterium]|nr:heparinase II/III family protein [Armatimonadota bacterium]